VGSGFARETEMALGEFIVQKGTESMCSIFEPILKVLSCFA
jgi:hypothetical protein